MAALVKAESSQHVTSGEERTQARGSMESGNQPPQHGTRQVLDRPFQPQQTGPRRDSDQLHKLGSRTASIDPSHLIPPGVLQMYKEPQHPVGVARRMSDELNQRSVPQMTVYGQHPQPQRSQSMPTLLDSSARANFIDTQSQLCHIGAGSTGTPGSLAAMHRSSFWITPRGSGQESARRTSLAPAVLAAAAALQIPLSARGTSQGSSFTSGMQRPLTPFCYALVAAFCLVVCLVMLFSLLSSLLNGGEVDKSATCTTHACREYAQLLLASLNLSVKPCHSFTRFVCDGWRRRQLLGVQEEAFGAANERITRIVHTIDVPPSGQSPLQRAAMLYRSCITVLATPTGEFADVKAALRAAGVMWPHKPPPIERRDLLRMMFHCDYTLGWSAVFRVDPELYENSTKAYVLTDSGFNFIVRKYHERNSEAHREHYFSRLRNAFRDEDATSDVVTFKEMQQLEEKMFGPLIAAFYKNAPTFSTVPADVVYSASANLSLDRWRKVLQREGVELVGRLEFRTWNLPFFSTFVNLLAHHGELDMYAYASWCTVQVAALFANGELILNFYGHAQRALVMHGAFCLSRAYIAASKALLSNYAREVLPVVARSHAESITLAVRAAFLQRLSTWPDYNANVSVIWKWDRSMPAFSIFVPTPKANFTDISVGEMGDSFLQNWHNAWLSRTDHRGIDIKIAITAIETLAFSADVEYLKDFVLLPYVFSFPYYDIHAISSINYGGFGAQVALAVGQRFHNTYLSAGAGGASFSAFLSCISNRSLSAERTDTASLFAEVVSLGALVDAYRNVSDNQRLVLLERLTGEQLLFIAICYAKCIGSYYIVSDSMCNAVLQNVPEFSKAFGCTPGTPMNPHERCKLL